MREGGREGGICWQPKLIAEVLSHLCVREFCCLHLHQECLELTGLHKGKLMTNVAVGSTMGVLWGYYVPSIGAGGMCGPAMKWGGIGGGKPWMIGGRGPGGRPMEGIDLSWPVIKMGSDMEPGRPERTCYWWVRESGGRKPQNIQHKYLVSPHDPNEEHNSMDINRTTKKQKYIYIGRLLCHLLFSQNYELKRNIECLIIEERNCED